MILDPFLTIKEQQYPNFLMNVIILRSEDINTNRSSQYHIKCSSLSIYVNNFVTLIKTLIIETLTKLSYQVYTMLLTQTLNKFQFQHKSFYPQDIFRTTILDRLKESCFGSDYGILTHLLLSMNCDQSSHYLQKFLSNGGYISFSLTLFGSKSLVVNINRMRSWYSISLSHFWRSLRMLSTSHYNIIPNI